MYEIWLLANEISTKSHVQATWVKVQNFRTELSKLQSKNLQYAH